MQVLSALVYEGQTALYTFELVDEAEVPVAANQVNSLTLTYFDQSTGTVINNRDNQDVLNTSDVILITEAGITRLEWLMQPEDTAILHRDRAWEIHVVQFEWSWAGLQRFGLHRIGIGVQRVDHLVAGTF
jgi:hypothetical protein